MKITILYFLLGILTLVITVPFQISQGHSLHATLDAILGVLVILCAWLRWQNIKRLAEIKKRLQ